MKVKTNVKAGNGCNNSQQASVVGATTGSGVINQSAQC